MRHRELLSSVSCENVRLDLLRLDFLRLLLIDNSIRNLSLCLECVLRVLRPHVVFPGPLNRFLGPYDFGAVMTESLATEGILELEELLQHLIILKVPQRLILHITIKVGR